MKHKITKALLILFAAFCFALLPIAPTFAQCSANVCASKDYPDSVKAACGCDNNNKVDELPKTILNIINVVIGISGLVAVVFIVVGGINYMTSAGDTSKVKKARDTILYATIGLVVCALSFAIANWAISAINGTSSSSNNSTSSPNTTNTTNTTNNSTNNNNKNTTDKKKAK